MADYTAHMEALKVRYEPKALALLNQIRGICRAAGLSASEPILGITDPEYRWEMAIEHVACVLTLNEEREHEGNDGWGVNWSLELIGDEGIIIGGVTPSNYTEDVWVFGRDIDAVDARFKVIEETNIEKIPNLIKGPGKIYTLSVAPLYPDGGTGEIFAEVSRQTIGETFMQMGNALADWKPENHWPEDDESTLPDALDLTLSWEGKD